MKIYAHYGYKDFVLTLGYKGEMIKDYFYNYELLNNDFTVELGNSKNIEIYSTHNEKDWRITLVDTGIIALKGARIKKIEKYMDDDLLMITYGDGIADINLHELVSFHKSHGRIGTLTGVRPLSRFGELLVKDNKVVSFIEKPQVSEGLINGGFFVFNRKIFNYLSEDDNCDFEIGPLEQLAKDGELMVYKFKGEWQCMDTFRDTQYLNRLWESKKAFWKVWKD
jgi:glucose-1-phosphate cytidylyltransferase